MANTLRRILRFVRASRYSYRHLIEIRVPREAILHNLREFQNLKRDVCVAPVLKSNAYGHGLVEVANILAQENVPLLCVDSYFEALRLRTEGIRTPILVIGYTPLQNILDSRMRDVAFAVIGLAELRELSLHAKKPIRMHLKVDTGMHRQGIAAADLTEACSLIRGNKRIVCEGIYTHFADADTRDSARMLQQIRIWNDVVRDAKKEFLSLRFFHCAATAGSFYANGIEANAMRLGIGLYGVNSGFADVDLRPALEMRTIISSVRVLQKGDAVGYNATFTAERPARMATIPAGYFEGVDRRLSNKGVVTVRGIPCPILGRVSMNITTIDVSNVPDASIGDEAVVISAEKEAPNSLENIAKACDTIPYEIMIHLPAHLHRTII